jgi:hypothetical protein
MKPEDSATDGGMKMLDVEEKADVSEAEYLMDDFAGDTDEEDGRPDEEIIVDDFLDDGEISYGSGSEKSGDDDRF